MAPQLTLEGLVGQVLLGRYELSSVLGLGGMAWVYKAKDLSAPNRVVAIKVLQPQRASKAPMRRRFLKEASFHERLQHPNIIQVYESHDVAPLPLIVMECVEGEPMGAFLLRVGLPLSSEVLVSIITPIVRAVGYAHGLQVIHRDLKPGNFLVDWSSGQAVPKVTDFGLVKAIGDEQGDTTTGTMMGTVSYISPEQAIDAKHVDQRTDIYSLGACMYEMATGRPPFVGTRSQVLIRLFRKQAPPSPREHNPSLDPLLEDVIMTCLAMAPDKRYQSCEELLGVLESHWMPLREPFREAATRPFVEAAQLPTDDNTPEEQIPSWYWEQTIESDAK